MREAKEQGTGRLPLGDVQKLVEMLRESGMGEIHIRSGDVEISVKAMPEVPATPHAHPTPETAAHPIAEPGFSPEANGLHEIKSPLVGTFYRAPAPGEDSFVEVGDVVQAGQTLCIVEAMKLMNEIPTDISGEVVEVLVENAAGVEYDQPLFHIKPEE
ncbi:MAG: acetyl-CoA carboxylase biotin carboxyl carrier protein [Rubrobacteraceae bacterium]